MFRSFARWGMLTALLSVLGIHSVAAQTPSGIVSGRVLDAVTNAPLPGADVTIDGTQFKATTDRDGNFRIAGVPAGSRTLLVTYLGRQTTKANVDVQGGQTAIASVAMPAEQKYQESVTVTALQADAQARALNQQKTALNIQNIISADQIGSFPDPNAAETTQRIPGISIARDMGEGRYVYIRGTEPRLNSTLIDGERIPAPEADVRQVALDVIPADLLQAVEVSKALTPDMDADAIGGTVNLVMKEAPAHQALFGTIGGGYNVAQDSYHQPVADITYGRRFAANKVGVIFSGSTGGRVSNTQDFEPVYTTSPVFGNLTDLDLRNYTVTRRRHGLTGAVDFRPAINQQYSVRGVYNNYVDDHEERQSDRQRVANRRIERALRDRTHIEHIWSTAFAGTQQYGSNTLDFHVSGAHADQRDPGTITTTFRQSNVNFNPNVSPTSIDPDNVQANPLNENLAQSLFNNQTRQVNFAGERDIVTAVNYRLAAGNTSQLTNFLKFGFKYRDKKKERTRDQTTYSPAAGVSIPIANVLQDPTAVNDILDGRYVTGPYMDMTASDDIINRYPMVSAIDHTRDSEDFDVKEDVASVYGMAELYLGSNLVVLPGLRYEHTSSVYHGNNVLFNASGAWVATVPTTGTHDYGTVLPGVNVRYAFNDSTNLRAAVTRSLARPNYKELVPYRSVDDSSNTLALGNPDLRPTMSWNADIMAEKYLKSVGVVSAGFFYKNLHDYIYVYTFPQVINGETFQTTQSQNGDAASIRGLELAFQSQLSFLPGALAGIGLYANYTLADSDAVFPARPESATLPGQSRNVGNVAVWYERYGFSGRVAVNFNGSFIDQVAASSGLDRFYDAHTQVDFSASQRLTKNVRAYVDVINVNNALLRYYQGTADRPLQEEHYNWWLGFGVKVDWR